MRSFYGYVRHRFPKRLRAMSPADAVGLIPYSLAASSALILLAVFLQTHFQVRSTSTDRLVSLSLWELSLALVLALAKALGWLALFSLPKRFSSQGCKAYLLAMQLGGLLLFVPAYLLVWKSPYEDMTWLIYPFLNKRWLFAFYWLAVATFLVAPHFFRRLMEAGIRRAASKQSAAGKAVDQLAADKPHSSAMRTWLGIAGSIVLALALTWFLAGPPWHIERHHRGIDFHEQVHLGPLQAISKGYVPYVGPASTQYGPGSQLCTFLLMKLSGHFDIVSYRESAACLHCLTVFVFSLAACLFLGPWYAVPALLLALAYSPLSFFYWSPDGTLDGFYGWGNGLRYAGVLVVVPTLPLLLGSRYSRRFPAWPSIALGVVWGLFSWLAQENLASTVAAGGLLLILLWLTGTAPLAAIGKVTGNMFCGFAAFWAPVLVTYAAHGMAGEFVRCYFLIPGMVAGGYSNTYWSSGATDPSAHAFYFTAPFLIVLGLFTLCDIRQLSLRRNLNVRQIRLLAFLCVLAACYPASLFRSDSTHLLNTMIALPFVLVLGFVDWPGWVATTRLGRWSCRLLILAAAFYLFPFGSSLSRVFYRDLTLGLERFAYDAGPPVPTPVPPLDTRVPFLRATRYLSDEPHVCGGNIAMRPFLECLSELHTLIGARKTYVQGVPAVYSGLIYFMLDVTPAPYLLDRETMMINGPLQEEALAYFKDQVEECRCIIATDLSAPEVKIFMQAHSDTSVLKRMLGKHAFYVVLADAEPVTAVAPRSRQLRSGGTIAKRFGPRYARLDILCQRADE